jgi:hypothetical protein
MKAALATWLLEDHSLLVVLVSGTARGNPSASMHLTCMALVDSEKPCTCTIRILTSVSFNGLGPVVVSMELSVF